MAKSQTRVVKLGEEFHPSPSFKSLNYLYFIVIFGALMLPLLLVLLVAPIEVFWIVALFWGLPIFLIFLFAMWWVPKYYQTMRYVLNGHEMTWRRGVWFRNTGIVSYNRITNIDIGQGPISRHFGIATLKIQTAGYSGSTTKTSEIAIEGVEHFEELREFIIGLVRGGKPMAVETYSKDEGSDVLGELVKIRKLLEKRK